MNRGLDGFAATSKHHPPMIGPRRGPGGTALAESPDLLLPIHFSDEEDGHDGSQLVEVSEGTYRLLKTVCMWSMSNDLRRRTQSIYKFPRVEATRTLKVDQVIKFKEPIKSEPAKPGSPRDHRDDLKRGGDRDTDPTRGRFFSTLFLVSKKMVVRDQ